MTAGGRARPVVLVFLLLAAVQTSLALRAHLGAPRGTVFVGTFFYVDDFYNYLSYVEQAQRGALVFRNKLAPPEAPPALVNLEWLGIGWLSALLGVAPLLAYRLAGLAALAALVALADRWLLRSGVAPSRRLAGLLLVFTGGGLGGILFALRLLPGERAMDVRTGAFPFVAALANPHFVIGTALLLGALSAYAAGRPWRGALLGTVLGLARPYDAALLAGIEALAVAAGGPPRTWPRRLLPVVALGPVLAYDAWVLLAGPGFRAFSSPRYAALSPSPLDLAIALGPAALLALSAFRHGAGRDGKEPAHRLRLALWALLAVGVVAAHPLSFSLQFIVGAGLPLLLLGAVGLSRVRRPGALEAAVPLMATTAVVVAWLCAWPGPTRLVPAERWRVAEALRPLCRPGDVVLSPPDVGLYVSGLTPCWAFVSHSAAPEHEARAGAVRRFYGEASPEERRHLLDASRAALVVLSLPRPPEGWLGGAPFEPRAEVPGLAGGLVVLARDAARAGRPSP